MARPSQNKVFRQLWPTLLMHDQVPGAEAPNRLLAEEIERRDRSQRDMTTAYLEDNLLESEHPAIAWLRDCINQAVIRYVQHTEIDYALQWHLQGWANINRFGDYHNLHNHPHAWLSGTYYVTVPTDNETLPGRDDRNPGAISFFDPRPQANMTAIRDDPQVDPEFRVLPEAGAVLLWPAFVHHLVHPNLSRSPRISVSFNVVLKHPEAHLPAQ